VYEPEIIKDFWVFRGLHPLKSSRRSCLKSGGGWKMATMGKLDAASQQGVPWPMTVVVGGLMPVLDKL